MPCGKSASLCRGRTDDVPSRKAKEAVTNNVTPLADASNRRKKRGPRRGKRKRRSDEARGFADRYGEVAEFARNGMSEREIADKVQLPRSEIELIMELNRG